jgi:hypothetical protein
LARLPWNILKTGPCSCWFLHPSRPPGCGSRQLCVQNRPTSESMWSNLQDPNLARESTANIRPCCGEKKKPRKNENPKFRNSPQSPSKKNRTTDQWIVIFGSSQLHQFPSVLMDWTPIPSIDHFQTHPTIISCLIPIRQTHQNHTKYAYIYNIYICIYIYVYMYIHMLCMPLYLLRISSDLSVKHIFDRLKSPEIWNHHKSHRYLVIKSINHYWISHHYWIFTITKSPYKSPNGKSP